MKKGFELFVYSTGCTTVYCNKAEQEYGEYKKLAQIYHERGEIAFLTAPEKIPGPVLLMIEHDADAIRANLKVNSICRTCDIDRKRQAAL